MLDVGVDVVEGSVFQYLSGKELEVLCPCFPSFLLAVYDN